jgi:hypothetical protein
MPTIEQVRAILRADARGERTVVSAQTFHQKWPSASRPVLCGCDDGARWVIKGSHNGRSLVADNVVGRLGQLLGAPVGDVGFVDIPDALKAIEPLLADVGTGIGHATSFLPDCTDKESVGHMDVPENRPRFALLTVLYSWALSNDPQCIYSKFEPRLVHSVDHGHFLNGSTTWSVATLQGVGPVAVDPYFAACGLSTAELTAGRRALEAITEDDIALVVADPPDQWGITTQEREALRQYLSARRVGLLALLPN